MLTTREAVISWVMTAIAAVVAVLIIIVTAHRDKTITVRYDCALLIGGWHPDFPPEAIEACRRKGITYDNSKTNYR
jgi:hypothetical protein